MKKMIILLLIISLCVSALCSCNNKNVKSSEAAVITTSLSSENNTVSDTNTAKVYSDTNDTKGEVDNIMNIQIGEHKLIATLVDNSSAKALKEILAKGPITIDMRDYEGMEKVGTLGSSLPRNDEQITTEAGDLILYQGNSFVIYYGPNSWNLTRLGKIENLTKEQLKQILGNGNVKVILSI